MRWVAGLALLVTACADVGPDCATPRVGEIAGVERGAFRDLAGAPVVPRAINSYPLLDHAGYDRWDDLRAILGEARRLGRPVVRTGAYMTAGENPARLRDEGGALREAGLERLDAVLAMAAAAGVQLLLVTANHWGDYGGAPAIVAAVAPGEGLPVEAFYAEPRALVHQEAFLTALAGRINTVNGRSYRTDPAIFAWELVNEARCDDPSWCDEDTLPAWSARMAGALRRAGARQPIAWGGQGYLGAHGEDLRAIATRGRVDVLTVHLYPDLAGAQTLTPGLGRDRVFAAVTDGVAAIERAAAVAREHRLPLLVEEAGWRAAGEARDEERALVLGAWARAAAAVGAGYAPWMIAEPGRPDYDGYLIRPESEPATERVLRCE